MPTEELLAPPKQSLMDIADQILRLFELLDMAETDEEKAAAESEIDRVVSVDLAGKVDAIAWFDTRCDMEVAAIEEHVIKEAEKRIGSINARKKRLRETAKRAMSMMGASLIKGQVHSIGLRAGVESLDVFDESQIPAPYSSERVITLVEVDKKALKQDLKAGRVIPGAQLKTGEPILTIR